MTVKELREALENGEFEDYDKVEIVHKLKSTANHYSVEYSLIDAVKKVMVGCGVYVVGIVSPQ